MTEPKDFKVWRDAHGDLRLGCDHWHHTKIDVESGITLAELEKLAKQHLREHHGQ